MNGSGREAGKVRAGKTLGTKEGKWMENWYEERWWEGKHLGTK